VGAGASALLAQSKVDPVQRYLLVSVGTGTSILLVDGGVVTRVGGTALGGGTLLGLAAGLLGTSDFDEIAALAQRGSRRNIDLLVSDIYPAGGIALATSPRRTSASTARLLRDGERAERADVAMAVMGSPRTSRDRTALAAATQVANRVRRLDAAPQSRSRTCRGFEGGHGRDRYSAARILARLRVADRCS
jgi:type II pantothenate kinase